jgi:hypothetical protein
MIMLLQWRRPDPLMKLIWRGPDGMLAAQLAANPSIIVPTIIGPPGQAGLQGPAGPAGPEYNIETAVVDGGLFT